MLPENIWRIGDDFIFAGTARSIASVVGYVPALDLLDGTSVDTTSVYWRFTVTGLLVKRYGPEIRYSDQEYLGITNIHAVVGTKLLKLHWWKSDFGESGVRVEEAVAGLEHHAGRLPLRVRQAVNEVAQDQTLPQG